MPLVLNGATSGSTTIQATDAVTATLTLPSSTGTLISTSSSGQVIPSGALPAGTVLQVVNASYGTTVTSSSSTNSDTGLTATITPKFSSSKILVLVEQAALAKANNTYMQLVLLRNSTQLATFGNALAYTASTAENRIGGSGMCYLDSPATTSATTYKTQFNSQSNTSYVLLQDNNGLSTITLMEIAA